MEPPLECGLDPHHQDVAAKREIRLHHPSLALSEITNIRFHAQIWSLRSLLLLASYGIISHVRRIRNSLRLGRFG